MVWECTPDSIAAEQFMDEMKRFEDGLARMESMPDITPEQFLRTEMQWWFPWFSGIGPLTKAHRYDLEKNGHVEPLLGRWVDLMISACELGKELVQQARDAREAADARVAAAMK